MTTELIEVTPVEIAAIRGALRRRLDELDEAIANQHRNGKQGKRVATSILHRNREERAVCKKLVDMLTPLDIPA